MSDQAAQLRDDGFCVIKGVLDHTMLVRVRSRAAACVAGISAEHRAKWRSEGSLINVGDHPEFADLIAFRPTLDALRGMGMADVRFSSGYVISKPPRGPALFWHQDWWGWDDPISATDHICQIFLFYYLSDTTRENGCLRVIPGSHRRRHPLHDVLQAHSAELARVADPAAAAFRDWPDERAVPVSAGDLVIGDARLLHGTYPNASGHERTLITLWYHPEFAALPAPIQQTVWNIHRRIDTDTDPGGGMTLLEWPQPARDRVDALLPRPAPSAAGVPPQPWNRTPAGLREPHG